MSTQTEKGVEIPQGTKSKKSTPRLVIKKKKENFKNIHSKENKDVSSKEYNKTERSLFSTDYQSLKSTKIIFKALQKT